MMLCDLECGIGIGFQKLWIEYLGTGISGIVRVIRAVRYAGFRSIGPSEATPREALAQLLGRRSEVSAP